MVWALGLFLFYYFVRLTKRFIRDRFVKSNLHGFMLAAGIDQRIRYADLLYVYGKDCVYMTDRQAELLAEFEVSLPHNQ